MTDQTKMATPTEAVTPPAATEPGHLDHMKEAIKDAAEKIVARVEHERSEHEHAAHDGRVHHAREAIQEALEKVGQKLPGGNR
jgi:ribosomal protein L16/L10AE